MKKSHAYILAAIAVIILILLIRNFDILYLLTTKNSVVQIVFFLLTIPVAVFLIIPIIRKKKLQIEFDANMKSLSKTEDFNMMFESIRKNTEKDFTKLKEKLFKLAGAFLVTNILLISIAVFVKMPMITSATPSGFYEMILLWAKILIIAIAWLIFGILLKNTLREYKMMYKNKVISVMVNWLRNGLVYEHKNDEKEKIFRNHYLSSGFEVRKFSVFSAEDYIYGNINDGVNIRFAEVCTKIIENIGTDNETARLLFNGLFGVTAIKTNINSTIKLLTDDLKLVIEDDFIKMDSPELEKNFDVYCSDKMLAMRIFTPETMEMLNAFYEKYKVAFEMIIHNNIIYLRFHTDDMFETNVLNNPLNKDKMFLYYSVLKFVFEITENINTNLNDLSM